MTDVKRKEIESLIDKAAKADKSEDAIRFSQAACNSANAMCATINAEKMAGHGTEREGQRALIRT